MWFFLKENERLVFAAASTKRVLEEDKAYCLCWPPTTYVVRRATPNNHQNIISIDRDIRDVTNVMDIMDVMDIVNVQWSLHLHFFVGCQYHLHQSGSHIHCIVKDRE